MKINKNLNLVELASEIAEVMLHNAAQQSGIEKENLYKEDKDCLFFTEETEDLFNEYYDDMWEYLVNKGFKHVNN